MVSSLDIVCALMLDADVKIVSYRWEIATAGLRAGIVVCPATTLLVAHDIAYRLQRTRASVFVGDSVSVAKVLAVRKKCPDLKHIIQIGQSTAPGVVDFNKTLNEVPSEAKFAGIRPNVDRAAMIYFTSGTSGPPKMVQHSAISYPLAHTITGKHWLRLKPGSLYWNLAEQGWGKAAWAYFGAWNCGAGLFVHDDRGAFSAETTLSVLQKYPITTLCAPPTAYRQLVLQEHRGKFDRGRIDSLVHCVSAGEPINPEAIRL
jgi:medium-chain acyl-CoA synthetase